MAANVAKVPVTILDANEKQLDKGLAFAGTSR